MADPESDHEKFLTGLYRPPPTPEKLNEVYEWSEERWRQEISDTLEQCMSRDHAMHELGIDDLDTMLDLIRTRTVVALEVGINHWLPKWQFTEDKKIDPVVQQAYGIWGPINPWGFCRMIQMTNESRGKSWYDCFADGTEEEVREAKELFKTHGTKYM